MVASGKRMRAIYDSVDRNKIYVAREAFEIIKKVSNVKFNESIDVSIVLGVNTRKSDQVIRRAMILPHGNGHDVRVAVFAQADKAEEAREAGADIIGFDDLSEQVEKGELNFDVVIATPNAMPLVGKLGPILGPKGLMPNPKVGTVTNDVSTAVKNAKSGQVRYRTDKNGVVHVCIGMVKFSEEDLVDNLVALILDLKRAKPSTSKGVYLKKIVVSSTMGPGLIIDKSSVEK